MNCHRTEVAKLVLMEARRQGKNVEVVEWPGGKPCHLKFDLDEAMFRSVCKGRMMIPLPKRAKFDELGGPPSGDDCHVQTR